MSNGSIVAVQIIEDRFALPESPVESGLHGTVYKARDLRRDRPVAFKLFVPAHVMDDRVLRQAWTTELQGYQTLGEHPNLVELIDWGRTSNGEPWLAFEWLPSDLFKHLDTAQIAGWDDYWPLGRDILRGLSVIHDAGFVHRDLKPENVLMTDNGGCKLADFGTMRLVERLLLGTTMAPLGTAPYAPPERGTATPIPAYDVYSFTVLSVVCLSGAVPTNHIEAADALKALDLPAPVQQHLGRGLSIDPAERPESASEVLAEFETLQRRRASQSESARQVFVNLPPGQLTALSSALGLTEKGVQDFVRDDMASIGAFAFDDRPKGNQPDLQIAGQMFLYRCQPHKKRGGIISVLRAYRAPAQVTEYARDNWWRPKINIRFGPPPNSESASRSLAEFLAEVAEHDAGRAEGAHGQSPDDLFPAWRRLLRAKFAIEDERSTPIRYSGFVARGSRIVFKVGELPDLEPNEGRLVRSGRRKVLSGEIDAVENDELSLFVTRGRASDLPPRGVLEFDAEASKSKLRREQGALERVCARQSLRPDLRDLLLDPSSSTPPPSGDEDPGSEDLDSAKRRALAAAIAAPDFLVVQGSPGTGKTTFIAALVARQLEEDPEARVLITSQTHIALDNALIRIRERAPQANLLRLGPSEKLTEEVEPLSVVPQLESWRQEVVQCGERFIREYARQLGIELAEVDVSGMADELKRRRDQLQELRSNISHRHDERRQVVAELERMNELAPEVFAAAELVDRAVKSSTGAGLVEAANEMIEQAIRLAASLEEATPLSERLIDLESRLAALRDDEAEQARQMRALSAQVATAIGADEGPVEDLIAEASRSANRTDPRVEKVKAIASDWHERFGKGTEFTAALLMRSDVVAATCVGLAGVPGVDRIPFDMCIVDEASKATATEMLVPLASSRRWILVGDSRQLPPFVEHSMNEPELLERFEIDRDSVHATLFASLAEGLPEQCSITLTHQHRMHPAIGGLISACFYDGALTSSEREISTVVKVALGNPVLWLDTSALNDRRERSSGTSIRNRCEAGQIASLLDRVQFVASAERRTVSVAVLTGYDAQRREILSVIAPGEAQRSNVEVHVATVDAYQGQEADIAIFSVTRSNEANALGFLRSEERINVALSRAREGLVIVGDSDFIDAGVSASGSPLYRVLGYIRKSADCSIERVEQ